MVEAYRAAYDCDRTSAFGGIVALNGRLDSRDGGGDSRRLFTEVVIAPEVDEAAAAILPPRKSSAAGDGRFCRMRGRRGWRGSGWPVGSWCRGATTGTWVAGRRLDCKSAGADGGRDGATPLAWKVAKQ